MNVALFDLNCIENKSLLSFHYRYRTGNNIDAHETGFIKDISERYPNGILVQHGEYSYEAPNGEIVNVQYTADEHGFRAVS